MFTRAYIVYTPDITSSGIPVLLLFWFMAKKKNGAPGAATWLGPAAASDPVQAAKMKK